MRNKRLGMITSFCTVTARRPIFARVPTELEHLYSTIKISSQTAGGTSVVARCPVVLPDLQETDIVRSGHSVVIHLIQIAGTFIIDDADSLTAGLSPHAAERTGLCNVRVRRRDATRAAGTGEAGQLPPQFFA